MKIMKYAIIAFAVSVMMLVGCTSLPYPKQEIKETQRIQYIINISDKEQDELYRLCNEWMVKTFKSAEAVIEYQDKNEGIIMGKGFLEYMDIKKFIRIEVNFTISLESKPEKVRLIFEAMSYKSKMGDWTTYPGITEEEFKEQSDPIAADLENYLKTGIEDW